MSTATIPESLPATSTGLKIICNRASLAKAIDLAARVAEAAGAKPLHRYVRLTAAGGVLTVEAANGGLYLRCTDREVLVERDGAAVVPCAMLRRIVLSAVADDTLALERAGGRDAPLRVIGGRSAFDLCCCDKPDDFPAAPDFDGTPSLIIDAGTMRRLIRQTAFAVSRGEVTRYNFHGALIVAKARRVEFVTTDGRRSAVSSGDLISDGGGGAGATNAIIPIEALNLMVDLPIDPQDPVEVRFAGGRATFRAPSYDVSAALIEGAFVPWQDVIPKDSSYRGAADARELLAAVEQVDLVGDKDFHTTRCEFRASGGLSLYARSANAGSAEARVAVRGWTGGELVIGFNATFLTDWLKAAIETGADEITMEFHAPNRPGLFSAGRCRCVVMPQNLQ